MIKVSDLHMRYGAFEAVRGLDPHVHRGEVFAFPGPNGAGKTTTVSRLSGGSGGGRSGAPTATSP